MPLWICDADAFTLYATDEDLPKLFTLNGYIEIFGQNSDMALIHAVLVAGAAKDTVDNIAGTFTTP